MLLFHLYLLGCHFYPHKPRNRVKMALQLFSECTVATLLKPLQFWCLLTMLQWCFKGLNVD